MGNYKSRPPYTCTEELLRRVLQSYNRLERKLGADLALVGVTALSPLQRACCEGDAIQLKKLLTPENVGERLETGLTLLHLCCLSRDTWRQFRDAEDRRSRRTGSVGRGGIASPDGAAPPVLQLPNTKPRDRNSKTLKKVQKLPSKLSPEAGLHRPDLSPLPNDGEHNQEKLTTAEEKSIESVPEKKSPKAKKSVKTCGKDSIRCASPQLAGNLAGDEAIACVKMLLDKGADTAIISKNGFSPLHLAAYQGCCDEVQLLAEHCPHIDHTGAGSLTALHLACLAGHLSVVRLLSQRGANIEARDQASYAPLHIAALLNHMPVVEYLVSRGVDVNISASVGTRALHLAAGGGHSAVALVLLQRGARVSLQDEEGHLPLHWSVGRGRAATSARMEVLAMLLRHHRRADVLTSNLYCDTPLHVACYHGRYECAKTLLTYGGPVQLLKENLWGETPLHAACTGGQSEDLVTFLLQQHQNYINHQSWDGHTPLHSACMHGHIDIVQLLLAHGADTSLTTHATPHYSKEDSSGQTAMSFAYEVGHDDIVSLLKQHQHRPAHTPLSPSSLLSPPHFDDSTTGSIATSSPETFPVPSPRGKLRAITREKMDVLHLRTVLPPQLHLSLLQIELIENIGSGSFGKVFKGRFGDKEVAVKRYRTNVSYGKSDVEMFCREVSILGSLDSPYIVQFIGACLEDPSQFAIVTAYVEGGSLFSTLHEQRLALDTPTRINIALDVARGMLYLHTLPLPIIHRDLNSHNILLTQELRARVADFGESRFVRSLLEENLTKQPGNLRWMAPEVFTQCTQYSTKADVFSFGLCLWELLTCQLPFAHLKPAAAAADMAYKHSRPPLDPVFPYAVSLLLDTAWHKLPDQRPHFAEIIEQLESIRDSQTEWLDCGRNGSCSGGSSSPQQRLQHRHLPYHSCCGPGRSSRSPAHPPVSPDRSTGLPTDDELSGHVSALRSRWEQEASRGQSAFKSSQAASDDPSGSVGSTSCLDQDLAASDDNNNRHSPSEDRVHSRDDAAGPIPSLLEELRSRVNNNGYVEGSTYQYRVANTQHTMRATAATEQ